MDLGGPFLLPPWFDYLATFIWALTGALIAARRRYDIAGITALAVVSATGGGLLRDGIFLLADSPASNVLSLSPPFGITNEEIGFVVEWLRGKLSH